MRRRFFGQTFRFLASATVIMLVLGTATGLIVRELFYRSMSSELDARGEMLARYIAERNADSILEEDSLALLDVQRTLVRLKTEVANFEYGFIENLEGRVLLHTFAGQFPAALHIICGPSEKHSLLTQRIDIGNNVVRDVALDVAGPATGKIHVGISEKTMEADLRALTRTLLAIFGGTFILSVTLVAVASSAITRPIQNLTIAAEKLGAGGLETRVEFKRNGEIGVLGDTFNRMAENLERSRNELQDLNIELEQSRDGLQELNLELEQSRDQLQESNIELEHSRDEIQAANVAMEEEIAEKNRVQDALALALREKEILLKEVHHRVKNNLQALSGLLNLQLYFNRDVRTRSILQDCCSRLGTMSLIHQGLYESRDVSNINFARYIEQLARQIMQSQSARPDQVKLDLDLEEANLPVDTAMPAGLILNELMTNSFKHAFPEGRQGRVLVRFKRIGVKRFRMEVQDDGRGFAEGFDFFEARSMGMQLVKVLIEQLGGTLVIGNGPGARFTIEFSEYLEAATLVV